jgi:hypothetical protein
MQTENCSRHDVVVGGRVAGSATAMLLARLGYDVVVVDQASFPSDTVSPIRSPAAASSSCAARNWARPAAMAGWPGEWRPSVPPVTLLGQGHRLSGHPTHRWLGGGRALRCLGDRGDPTIWPRLLMPRDAVSTVAPGTSRMV